MSAFQSAYDAHLTISGHDDHWREIVGNVFGLASRDRRDAAQGLGVAGRHRSATCCCSRSSSATAVVNDQHDPDCWGRPAGRSSSSPSASTAGAAGEHTKHAGGRRRTVRPSQPRWATAPNEPRYLLVAGAAVMVLFVVFKQIGAVWPAPTWYFLADAWILTGIDPGDVRHGPRLGRLLAVWIAVDLVGVPAADPLPSSTRRRSCTPSTASSGGLRLLRLAADRPRGAAGRPGQRDWSGA